MKLKKIRNYILTFVICLFSAFVFNSVETKAYTSVGGIQISEPASYYVYQGDQNRQIIFYGNVNDLNKISMFYYNDTSGTYAFYPSCTASMVNIVCSGNRVNGGIGNSLPSSSQNNITITPLGSNKIRTTWANDGDVQEYDLVDISTLYYDFGYEDGERVGFNQGYEEGRSIGYEEGANASNTLVGMVGAIFTGPVTMFEQIFNFNVLGINFAEMLLGLVTLLVVIWLIKKFI